MSGNPKLAKYLKAYRAANGLSQRDLAEQIGISSGTLACWEAERADPSATYVVTVARSLKVSTDELLGLKETPWLKEKKR